MSVSLFEAAHELPAVSSVSSIDKAGDYCAPDTMDQPVITAMQTTAKAMQENLRQLQIQDVTSRAKTVNNRGFQHDVKVGDLVRFYIPPTAEEAKRASRKSKHIVHFKGPAKVTKQLSETTFTIEYEGSTYGRCLSELRAYKTIKSPNVQRANEDSTHKA